MNASSPGRRKKASSDRSRPEREEARRKRRRGRLVSCDVLAGGGSQERD